MTMKKDYYIQYGLNVKFSYNSNLGTLQGKTIDNLEFADVLLNSGTIDKEEWQELKEQITAYFRQEIDKISKNPLQYLI